MLSPRFAMFAACLVAPVLAQANNDRACMLEGSFSLMGKTVLIKDCMQHVSLTAAQFAQSCQGVSQSAAALGAAPAKITYLPACPSPSQGICEKMFGGPITGYYYQRDPAALKDTEVSCKAGGGVWKKG